MSVHPAGAQLERLGLHRANLYTAVTNSSIASAGVMHACSAPLSIVPLLVCRSLLPVNFTSYEPDPSVTPVDANGTTTVNDAFLKMTMSAIPHGSSVLW